MNANALFAGARVGLLLVAAFALAACTRIQFHGVQDRLDITPQQAPSLGPAALGRTVIWGGRIVAVRNLAQGTELLVLGLPLSSGHVPRVERESVGRFVVAYPAFLEPLDYAPGRYVSLAGRIESLDDADWTGEAPPGLARLSSGQVHLWPRDPARWQPRISIGVGVGFGR